MKQYPTLRRWLAALMSLIIVGTVVVVAATSNRSSEKQPAAATQPTTTDPWPMWGGALNRNMVNFKEKNAPVDWEIEIKDNKGNIEQKAKNILWTADLGSKAYGGPVIADGKIFIGTNNEKPRDPKIVGDKGILMCFEEKTGKFLWQRVHDKLKSGQVNDWPKEGICSTPFIEGKRVYYVSNRCELVCCTTDGKDVWTFDMIKALGVFPHNLSTSSPLVVGDLVYAITSNGVNENHIDIPAPAAPSFVAVDKNTGKDVWTNNDPTKRLLDFVAKKGNQEAFIKALVNKGEVMMHGQWSSPAYAEVGGKGQIIFPGGDGWLRSFEPKTGALIWKFDCNPKNSKYKLGGEGTRNDFIATPVVYDNKVYIGVGQDPEHNEGIGHFWCIDITKKGDVSPKDDNFDPKAPVNKDSALVWHYGEPAPKEWKKGRNYVFGRTMSTAAIHDDLVYIAEMSGHLHCLDAKTGQPYWVYHTKSAIWSSASWIDGKIYLGNDGEVVHIFEHGKKLKLVGQPIEMGGVVRATPIMANGVLYVLSENKLYAIKR